MKSYNDLCKQVNRIEIMYLNAQDTPRNKALYTRAINILKRYRVTMQDKLARVVNGRDAGIGYFWTAEWERSKDTKVPRSVYAGY